MRRAAALATVLAILGLPSIARACEIRCCEKSPATVKTSDCPLHGPPEGSSSNHTRKCPSAIAAAGIAVCSATVRLPAPHSASGSMPLLWVPPLFPAANSAQPASEVVLARSRSAPLTLRL
jgi:hypothetical protein